MPQGAGGRRATRLVTRRTSVLPLQAAAAVVRPLKVLVRLGRTLMI
jgi:hypothetical protein